MSIISSPGKPIRELIERIEFRQESVRKFETEGGLVSGTEESRGRISIDRPNRQWGESLYTCSNISPALINPFLRLSLRMGPSPDHDLGRNGTIRLPGRRPKVGLPVDLHVRQSVSNQTKAPYILTHLILLLQDDYRFVSLACIPAILRPETDCQCSVISVDYNGVVPEKFDVVKLSHLVDAEYGNQGLDFKLLNREGFAWTNCKSGIREYLPNTTDGRFFSRFNSFVPDRSALLDYRYEASCRYTYLGKRARIFWMDHTQP